MIYWNRKPFRLKFKWWQIIAALVMAAAIFVLDLKLMVLSDLVFIAPHNTEEVRSGSIVINGFDNVSQHRIFDKPDSLFDKRILMLGACQVSSLHWFYTPEGFDPSGRSSLPYLLEKELQKNPQTSNLYVYNLGMEGTGYLEALYFLLSAYEQPNIRLVILSISQEGDTHIPDDTNKRYWIYSRLLPKMERLLERYHKESPDIAELKDYYEYVRDHSWTVDGRAYERGKTQSVTVSGVTVHENRIKDGLGAVSSFLEQNTVSLSLKYHARWISANTSGFLRRAREWLGIGSLQENHATDLKPEEWYIHNFEPCVFAVAPRTYARYTQRDETVIRLMAKLLAKKKIDLWIQNPPDLAVQMSSLVNDRWWEPLKQSVKDLPNVKTIDMSGLPLENGMEIGGRVAPTYYGAQKTMRAYLPYVLEWNKHD